VVYRTEVFQSKYRHPKKAPQRFLGVKDLKRRFQSFLWLLSQRNALQVPWLKKKNPKKLICPQSGRISFFGFYIYSRLATYCYSCYFSQNPEAA